MALSHTVNADMHYKHTRAHPFNKALSGTTRVSRWCLQCFDTVDWAVGRASGLQKLSGGVLAWLYVWSEVQTSTRPS